MRTLLAFTLILLSQVAIGQQFAIVSDKDGYTNVRSAAGTANKIEDTLHNDHFVYCFETKDGWTNIEYANKKDDYLHGYIYHDRLRFIADYEKIPNLKKSDSIFVKDSLKVIVSTRRFVKARYHITYSKPSHEYDTSIIGVVAINGRKVWGTDGEMPSTEYASISVNFGARHLVLPRAAFEDLFQPTIWNTKVNYDRKNDILYIVSENSDGAGAYGIIWKIEKGAYAGRYIAYGD